MLKLKGPIRHNGQKLELWSPKKICTFQEQTCAKIKQSRHRTGVALWKYTTNIKTCSWTGATSIVLLIVYLYDEKHGALDVIWYNLEQIKDNTARHDIHQQWALLHQRNNGLWQQQQVQLNRRPTPLEQVTISSYSHSKSKSTKCSAKFSTWPT